MAQVSVQEAKAHFSAVLRRAESGETIVVTRHNRPIVELRPAHPEVEKEQIAKRIAALNEYLDMVRVPVGFDPAKMPREDLYD